MKLGATSTTLASIAKQSLTTTTTTPMKRIFRPWASSPSSSISRPILRRPYASPATPPPNPQSRLSKVESHLPKFLHRYLQPLRSAPLSHITAFLILHELTAIVPLFGLAAAFHYTNWLPPYISEGKWVSEGTERFGKWMKKRGWLGEEEGVGSRRGRYWGWGETGTRVVVELATAYAITKAMLPLRLVVSVWGTPWFARWTVLPVTGWVGRVFRRGGKKVEGGVGTNAVGGGAVPKKGE